MRGVKVLNQRSCLLFTNPSPTLFCSSQNIICTFLIPNPLVKLSDLSLAVGYSTHAIHDFKQSGSLSFSTLAPISFLHFPHSIARNTGDRITVLSCYGNIVNSARRIAGYRHPLPQHLKAVACTAPQRFLPPASSPSSQETYSLKSAHVSAAHFVILTIQFVCATVRVPNLIRLLLPQKELFSQRLHNNVIPGSSCSSLRKPQGIKYNTDLSTQTCEWNLFPSIN